MTRITHLFPLIISLLLLFSCKEDDSTTDSGQQGENFEQIDANTVQSLLDSGMTPKEIYDMNPNTIAHIEGSFYEGGYIFAFDIDKGDGLIMAQSDIDMLAYGPCVPVRAADLGDSPLNGGVFYFEDMHLYTDFYETTCDIPGSASDLCANYISNGYSDWFMPNFRAYQSMDYTALASQADFLVGRYWAADFSSNQRNMLYQNGSSVPYNPSFTVTNKNTYKVRPIRYFNTIHQPSNPQVMPQTIKEKLISGKTPHQLLDEGTPLEDLYGHYYNGGILFAYRSNENVFLVADHVFNLDPYFVDDSYSTFFQWGCIDYQDWSISPSSIYGDVNTEIVLDASCHSQTTNGDFTAFSFIANYRTALETDTPGSDSNYTNYFIPSPEELIEVYNNVTLSGLPYIPAFAYWSSKSWINFQSYAVSGDNVILNSRNITNRVLPVRKIEE